MSKDAIAVFTFVNKTSESVAVATIHGGIIDLMIGTDCVDNAISHLNSIKPSAVNGTKLRLLRIHEEGSPIYDIKPSEEIYNLSVPKFSKTVIGIFI
jgi:hypothetical protein